MTSQPRQEKRRARRYPITAPVAWESGDGITQNVSTCGVYFLTAQPFKPGQPVELTVTLPRQAIPVRGQGTVVRVDNSKNGRFGVGVRFDLIEPLPVKKD